MELRVINPNEDKGNELYASEECQQLINTMNVYYPKIGFHKPWVGYFVVRDNQVVGSCSFTGKSDEGKVEIAYWTFREFEGQGVASFACKELIGISQVTDPAVSITAKTEPAHNASTKILQKVGFVYTATVQDHEIGDAWLWTLKSNEDKA